MDFRTPEYIDAVKRSLIQQASQQKVQQSSIQSLPPGFIKGFRMVLQPDGNVDIGPGVANVGGLRIERKATYRLKEADELVDRLGGGWRYAYIDKSAAFHVDVLAPVYNTDYQDYYSPYQPWRFIGRLWLGTDKYYKYAYRGIYGNR